MDQVVPICIDEADATLSNLLDRVERGERVTVTRQGRPLARLEPIRDHDPADARAALERLGKLRERLLAAHGPVTLEEILSSRHEGHRY